VVGERLAEGTGLTRQAAKHSHITAALDRARREPSLDGFGDALEIG
jgi:hypothetical protein